MKIEINDYDIFNQVKVIITTESMDDLYALVATFNTSIADRIKNIPHSLDDKDIEFARKALQGIDMKLWEGINPIYKDIKDKRIRCGLNDT